VIAPAASTRSRYPGEILELPDGTQIIVESIEHSLNAGIDADVRVRPAS
jgi:CMP-2-keto-3-deoxyoctulosonic acid synthetase